jgi:PhnB protein
MFFGSREGRVTDPFGNVWTIATLKEEVAPEDMQRRMKSQVY